MFTLFLFLILSTQAQDYVYDFPVNPNTKEWENLKTETERFNAMQIPSKLLKSMSTENLIITCINYPAFGHYTAFNNIQDGISRTIKNFNGLRELLFRQDAPSKMLSVYSELYVSKNDIKISKNDIKNIITDFWGIRICYFELLLAKDEIIGKLNDEEKITLIKEVKKKISERVENEEQNSLFSIQPCLLIIAKILDESNYMDFQKKKKENTDIEILLNTGSVQNLSLVSSLIEMADNYINSK
jgi:hypothetical protein